MSSDQVAIRIEGLGKRYEIYDRPGDRLKQFIFPRLQRLLGLDSRQYFKEFWALKDVSFEVKKGETIGIIGRNGSGKSTLLQIICGTLNPTNGLVQTSGRVAALLELGSGFNPEFTGRENVYLNASVMGLTNEEIDARLEEIISFADIGDFIDQPTKTYSSGMMVRLAFSVIAHVDADILVVDEALAVGDAFFTQKCMRFLRSFMKTGSILFVSHDTSSIKGLCNRAIWLEHGVILQQGTPKDVCENYLQAFYEQQQGKSSITRIKKSIIADAGKSPQDMRDQRQDFINHSNLRNDIKLAQFNPEAASFGSGDAEIVAVNLCDSQDNPLSWVLGGEMVSLIIEVIAHSYLASPIIGFFVKDKLGQHLFGDNTWLSYMDEHIAVDAGNPLIAKFEFRMPILAVGEYSIAVAVASGTQNDHVQHQWIHDAVSFKSESTSVAGGLIGIPMHSISLLAGDKN